MIEEEIYEKCLYVSVGLTFPKTKKKKLPAPAGMFFRFFLFFSFFFFFVNTIRENDNVSGHGGRKFFVCKNTQDPSAKAV